MSDSKMSVPIIDVGSLFDDEDTNWVEIDAAIGTAAREIGAFVAIGLPDHIRFTDHDVAQLHRVFELSDEEKHGLATQRVNGANSHKWRGYYATLKGGWAHNEFFDIGPTHKISGPDLRGIEILAEANVWPPEDLPYAGWKERMTARYTAMQSLGETVLGSLVRSLGADETLARAQFDDGYGCLRLLNYPAKPEDIEIGSEANATRVFDGEEQPLLTVEHDDSCALSILWQDAKGGLQIQTPTGEWLAVPKVDGGVSIHFGDAIEPLTSKMLKATPHRVLGPGGRQSMGFFLEPNLDAKLLPFEGLPDHDSGEDVEVDTYASSLLKVLVRRGMYTDLILG